MKKGQKHENQERNQKGRKEASEEVVTVTPNVIESCVRAILIGMGENTTREGLLETPMRYRKFLEDWHLKTDKPFFKCTTFAAEGMDQMIAQSNIPFYSLCEHHLLPFFGQACVAYIPKKKIIGLSKLARLVDFYARRPQNQERITKQVAEFLQSTLDPIGVGVVLKARHLCMEMRGVKAYGSETTTSYLLGAMKKEDSARNEFLSLARETLAK